MSIRQREDGQSILELTLVLPFIFLLLVAVVEAGFALRDYVMVQSVNREGVRWAVRMPPTGGESLALENFRETQVPAAFNRIREAADNAGLREEDVNIILTHIYLIDTSVPSDGIYDQPASDMYVSPAGFDAGNSQLDVATLESDNFAKYTEINNLRGAAAYDTLDNELVVVEVFYRHETLWGIDIVGPFGADWTMYAKSSMRMIGTGRSGSE